MSHGSASTGSKPSKASLRKSPSSISSMSEFESSSAPDDADSKQSESCDGVDEQTESSGGVHCTEEVVEVEASVIFTAGRKLTWFHKGTHLLRDHDAGADTCDKIRGVNTQLWFFEAAASSSSILFRATAYFDCHTETSDSSSSIRSRVLLREAAALSRFRTRRASFRQAVSWSLLIGTPGSYLACFLKPASDGLGLEGADSGR